MSNPIWQDMLFLQELDGELHQAPGAEDDTYAARGFKPYHRDPRWLTWLSFALLALTVVALLVILRWINL
jgi:hypothetical protein